MRCMTVVAMLLLGSGCATTTQLSDDHIPAWTYGIIQKTSALLDDMDNTIGIASTTFMREGISTDKAKSICEQANIGLICDVMRWEEQCASVQPPVTTQYLVHEVLGEPRLGCTTEVRFTN